MKEVYCPIFYYHRVCPQRDRGPDSPSLCVTPGQFQAQMSLLKILGYTPISIQNYAAWRLGQKNIPERSIVLTFDDGYEDNFTHAFPILRKLGLTANFFMVTGGIGKKNFWDSGTIPLLKENQIEEMARGGMVFGSHTESHIDMSRENEGKIREELSSSRKRIENITRRLDTPFCYPYARVKLETKHWIKEAGYICALAGDTGEAGDLFHIPRIQVFPSTGLFRFWRKTQSWYPRWKAYQKKFKA